MKKVKRRKKKENGPTNLRRVMKPWTQDENKCHWDTCSNHGLCVDGDANNGAHCDCDLTSFAGPTCADGINGIDPPIRA